MSVDAAAGLRAVLRNLYDFHPPQDRVQRHLLALDIHDTMHFAAQNLHKVREVPNE